MPVVLLKQVPWRFSFYRYADGKQHYLSVMRQQGGGCWEQVYLLDGPELSNWFQVLDDCDPSACDTFLRRLTSRA